MPTSRHRQALGGSRQTPSRGSHALKPSTLRRPQRQEDGEQHGPGPRAAERILVCGVNEAGEPAGSTHCSLPLSPPPRSTSVTRSTESGITDPDVPLSPATSCCGGRSVTPVPPHECVAIQEQYSRGPLGEQGSVRQVSGLHLGAVLTGQYTQATDASTFPGHVGLFPGCELSEALVPAPSSSTRLVSFSKGRASLVWGVPSVPPVSEHIHPSVHPLCPRSCVSILRALSSPVLLSPRPCPPSVHVHQCPPTLFLSLFAFQGEFGVTPFI